MLSKFFKNALAFSPSFLNFSIKIFALVASFWNFDKNDDVVIPLSLNKDRYFDAFFSLPLNEEIISSAALQCVVAAFHG